MPDTKLYAFAAAKDGYLYLDFITSKDEFLAEWGALELADKYFDLRVDCLDEVETLLSGFNIQEVPIT